MDGNQSCFVSDGFLTITQTSSSLVLSFEEFLARYADNPRYELADGELVDRSLTGTHETVAGKVASQLNIECDRKGHPWIISRTRLLIFLPINSTFH